MKVSHHQLTELRNAGVIKNYNQRTNNEVCGILIATFKIGDTEITCQSSVDIEGWYGFHEITHWQEYSDGDRIEQYNSGWENQIQPDDGQTPIDKIKSYENGYTSNKTNA